MIKKLQLDLLMYIPIRFYTSFGIIKLISQISQISRDIHAYNIAPRDILKVRYLLHPRLVNFPHSRAVGEMTCGTFSRGK